MTTYREAIYMCLDLLKSSSDDFSYTQDHIIYLLEKYRALLLNQRYGKDPKKHIPYSNYQTIMTGLQPEKEGPYYTSGKAIVSPIMNIGIPRITSEGYYNINYTFTTRERLPFVGNNKFITNNWYFALDDRDYLIAKGPENSEIPSGFFLTAIFETPSKVIDLMADTDLLDAEFPLEEELISTLIETVVKVLNNSIYKPEDSINDSRDDLASLYSFIARNVKSDLAKQLQ